jgi:hypothetical protein
MKFNKLARELNLSVNDLAEKVKAILPNANGGTEVSDEQIKAIKQLLADSKAASKTGSFPLTDAMGGANTVFPIHEPSDQEVGIAALAGMVREYEHRLRGLTVAHQWIHEHEETGHFPEDPVAAKLIKAVCLLRGLNIPYQNPQPMLPPSGGSQGSGVSLPPLVRSILGNTYPDELADIDRELPEQAGENHLQLSASQ